MPRFTKGPSPIHYVVRTLSAFACLSLPIASAVSIEALPEPLLTNFTTEAKPSIKNDLEARISAILADPAATKIWVSPNAGPGGTGSQADPMNLADASNYATANRGASLFFEPGNYDARGFSLIIDYRSGINSSSDFVIAAPQGQAVFDAGHLIPTSAMTPVGGNVYSFPFDGSIRDTPTDNRLMMLPQGGDGRSYFQRESSSAAVADEEQRYYYDVTNQTVYVRFKDDVPVDVTIGCSLGFASFHSSAATIGMYGLTFNHFRNGIGFSNTLARVYECHINYAWDFGNRTDGWRFSGNTQSTLQNSSGNYVQNDGFNQKGQNTYVKLIDCEAIGNNDDGFSPHRATERWEVWGGTYKNNGKGNITPAGGYGFLIDVTMDTVLGRVGVQLNKAGSFYSLSNNDVERVVTYMKRCRILNTGGVAQQGLRSTDALSDVYMINCSVDGFQQGLVVEGGGQIRSVNTTFINNQSDYTPQANIEILGNDPLASFQGTPLSGNRPLTVSFDASASFDPDGTLVQYDWDFGDGTTRSDAGITPKHTYSIDGTYSVTLTVRDDEGNTGSLTETDYIFVGNKIPTASFSFSPNSPDALQPVSFDASLSSDEDGSIVRYDWDFGDGTVNPDAGSTPTHSYSTGGDFLVSLTVTDTLGATNTQTHPITVLDPNNSSRQTWDFEAGSGNRSFAEMDWEAYASHRDNNSQVTNRSQSGAFPAVIKEDNRIGGSSLALLDADGASNAQAAQFYTGTQLSVPLADAISFRFKHISSTGSSDGSKFLRIAIQLDNGSWYLAEQAIAESPGTVREATLLFADARWISWEDPRDGFSNVATFATSGGSSLNNGTLQRIGIVMASGRNSDSLLFDEVELLRSVLPPPTAPEINMNLQGADPELQVPSQSGYLYRLRGTDELGSAPSTWPVIGEAKSGDGSILVFDLEDPATLPPGAKRFYVIEVNSGE